MPINPPIASPQPPRIGENEHPSGSQNIATIREALLIADKAAEKSQAASAKLVLSSDVKWFVGSVVAAIGIAFLVFFKLEAHAQDKVDAGIAPVERRLTALEKQSDDRFTRLEKKVDEGQYRQDLKMDALLLKLNVPNPAPTPAKDGGSQ